MAYVKGRPYKIKVRYHIYECEGDSGHLSSVCELKVWDVFYYCSHCGNTHFISARHRFDRQNQARRDKQYSKGNGQEDVFAPMALGFLVFFVFFLIQSVAPLFPLGNGVFGTLACLSGIGLLISGIAALATGQFSSRPHTSDNEEEPVYASGDSGYECSQCHRELNLYEESLQGPSNPKHYSLAYLKKYCNVKEIGQDGDNGDWERAD